MARRTLTIYPKIPDIVALIVNPQVVICTHCKVKFWFHLVTLGQRPAQHQTSCIIIN